MKPNKDEQPKLSESGTESLRGAEKTSQYDDHRDSGELIGQDGGRGSNQSLGISGTVGAWTGIDQSSESETRDSKKLIDQLDEFFGSYILYVEAHEQRLKTRLDANHEQQKLMKAQFESLKQSLLQLVDQDN